MDKRSGRSSLVFKTLYVFFVCRGVTWREYLEGTEAMQAGVACEVDQSHAATSQQFLALVDIQSLSGLQREFGFQRRLEGEGRCVRKQNGVSPGSFCAVRYGEPATGTAADVPVEMMVAGIAVKHSHGESVSGTGMRRMNGLRADHSERELRGRVLESHGNSFVAIPLAATNGGSF
jgi:hypothetical protein